MTRRMIAVDTPDPKDPKDFSDFKDAKAQLAAEADAGKLNEYEVLGFTPYQVNGKWFLLKYPKFRERILMHLAGKMQDAARRKMITTEGDDGEDTAEAEDMEAFFLSQAETIRPIVYLPSSTGREPVQASADEVLEYFDITDVQPILEYLNARSAGKEWAAGGGDPKASRTTTIGALSAASS